MIPIRSLNRIKPFFWDLVRFNPCGWVGNSFEHPTHNLSSLFVGGGVGWLDLMGFFRRIAGFLGLTREEDEAEEDADARHPNGGGEEGGRTGAGPPRAAARGFSVHVPVAVERPSVGPVLVPCDPGEGGVQVLSSNLVRGSTKTWTFICLSSRFSSFLRILSLMHIVSSFRVFFS